MKKSYLVQKSLAFILFTFCSVFVTTNLYAQRESFTDDLLAGSLSGTTNTGTDVIHDDENGGRIQVMVADGGTTLNPLNNFYWDIAGNTGSFIFDNAAPANSDPDVVIGKRNGKIYALVVYINANKEVGWKAYELSGGIFGPNSVGSGTLGYGQNGGYHGCSNPNVDVNNGGQVVVVWAESYTHSLSVSFTPSGGSEVHAFSQSVNISRGDIWAGYGFVDGTSPSGSGSLKGATNIKGDKISQFDRYLFEKNTQPDVAIADVVDERPGVVTYTYLQNYMADDYSTGTYLMAQREAWNASILTYDYPLGNHISVTGSGAPRIASRKYNSDEFEIVLAKRRSVSACGNIPEHTVGTIFNYGVYDGAIHGFPNEVIVNPDLQGTDNLDPVVTYDANAWTGETSGDFIVTWTTRSNCPPIADNGLNVISRTMTHEGETVTYLYDNYSFVNKGNLNTPERDTRGDQEKPSVAGVYLGEGSVYFFKDTYGGNMLYKHSSGLDGRGNLRFASNVTLTSFPNPFGSQAKFIVTVPANDLAQELQIYDIKGTTIAHIKLKEISGVQEIVWKPRAKLLQGMYFARIVTLKQTQTIKLLNQE